MKKIELLAPAGSPEKLEVAIRYGADAVYLAGRQFNLRNAAPNFSADELPAAVDLCRRHGVKCYIACNIYLRDSDLQSLIPYLERLGKIGPDALIVADPGVIALAREMVPHIALHLSTQANTGNSPSVAFWAGVGIRRINAAREMTLQEIASLAAASSVEVEAFVHGAMCMAYSGRCHLSSYLCGRESNRGDCAHPCRWRYTVVEERRPGRFMPVTEGASGSSIFHAFDLCMLSYIPELIESGLSALKIEGRMKGIHFLSSVLKTYREAIDSYYRSPADWRLREAWVQELKRFNHRGYCSGFYFSEPARKLPRFERSTPAADHLLIGKAVAGPPGALTCVDIRSKVYRGETVEILSPGKPIRRERVRELFDEGGRPQEFVQPGRHALLALGAVVRPLDMIRRPDDPFSESGRGKP